MKRSECALLLGSKVIHDPVPLHRTSQFCEVPNIVLDFYQSTIISASVYINSSTRLVSLHANGFKIYSLAVDLFEWLVTQQTSNPILEIFCLNILWLLEEIQ